MKIGRWQHFIYPRSKEQVIGCSNCGHTAFRLDPRDGTADTDYDSVKEVALSDTGYEDAKVKLFLRCPKCGAWLIKGKRTIMLI